MPPNFMLESSRCCELIFEKTLEKLISCKQLSSMEANIAKLEFSKFLSTTVKENKDFFVKFDKGSDHVETFIWQFFLNTNKFIKLKKVLKMFMLLSHRQAAFERGFSANGKRLVENLHMESLIAQNHIHNYIQSYGFAGSWFGYYTCIVRLCQFCQKMLFSEPGRDCWQKKSLLMIVSWLNWMKRFRS